MLHFRSLLRYSAGVTRNQTHPEVSLPLLWLVSDARNDAALEQALRDLPRGSGFIYRHYHLADGARRNRFDELSGLAQAMGHLVILSAEAAIAREWGSAGIYGSPKRLANADGLLRLATVHNGGEIAQANRIGADAALLSPVFPTKSHPGGASLGPARFRELAGLAEMPVIALGGMTTQRAAILDWPRWAAVDGLVSSKES